MTFGDELAVGLAELRGHAATRRRSSTVIYRPIGVGPIDPVKLRQIRTWTRLAPVPARVKPRQSGSQPVVIGGRSFPLATGVLEMDHAAQVETGDHFHIATGESAGLVGRILAVPDVDDATGLRLPFIETQYQAEWG